MAQIGTGEHVIDMRGSAPAAVQFFQQFLPWLK
jgi:hypothetical protein